MTTEGRNIWQEAHDEYDMAQPMICMSCKTSELKTSEYGILDGACNPLYLISAVGQADGLLVAHAGMQVGTLYESLMSIPAGEESRKHKKCPTL